MDPYEDVAAKRGDNPDTGTSWDDLDTDLPRPGEVHEHPDAEALENAVDSPAVEPADVKGEETEVNSYGEGA